MPTSIKLIKYDWEYKNLINTEEVNWNKNSPIDSNNNDENICTIIENVPYQIDIQLNSKDRLYIDGIEFLSNNKEIIATDKDGINYINHSTRLNLYNNYNHMNKYLPGMYQLHLVHDDINYYAWLHVRSKFLNSKEFNQLIGDLENTSEGLSESFRQGYHGITNNKDIKGNDLQILRILEKYYNSFSQTIFSLKHNLRSEVTSTYKWGYNIGNSLDYRSIIKMTSNPQSDKIFSKHHCINYNIIDNINLKTNLLQLRNSIQLLLPKYSKRFPCLNKYLNYINYLINYSALTKVITRHILNNQNNASLVNPNYRFISELIQKLQKPYFQKNFQSRDLAFNFKSTEYLYEVWGYLQVLKNLRNLDFYPISGWLIDNDEDIKQNIAHGLSPGTTVKMKLDHQNDNFQMGMQVNIIYNASIPHTKDKANPVWTTNKHNIPDIRLDFFDLEQTFIGSLIIDTKYRKVTDFMQHTTSGSLEQLSAYKQFIISPKRFQSSNYNPVIINFIKSNGSPAVNRVGAMFPGILSKNDDSSFHIYGTNVEKLNEKLKNEVNIYTLMCYPGNQQNNLKEFLINSIKDILENTKNALK